MDYVARRHAALRARFSAACFVDGAAYQYGWDHAELSARIDQMLALARPL